MKKNVWLHFDIGSANNCVMYPASSLVGMHPSADGTLTLIFKSMRRPGSPYDKVVLNLFENNTHLDVMKTIGRAMHNQTSTFGGFINIANDSTDQTMSGFNFPRGYITDDNQENGKIASIDSVITQGETTGKTLSATTASSFAEGTLIPSAGQWFVSSDDANKVLRLPETFNSGDVVWLSLNYGSSGFELRAFDSGDRLNNITGEVEMAIDGFTTCKIIECRAISGTEWLINYHDNVGNYDHPAIADAI